MSNQRKPGDYVVNAELTEEQIEAFVGDCVTSGYADEGDAFQGWAEITRLGPISNMVGGHDSSWPEVFKDVARNVTEEYKEQPMTTLDLPTVLEECAEHIRAGRNLSNYFEVQLRDGRWVYPPNGIESIVEHVKSVPHALRRKQQTITVNGKEVSKPDDVFWTDIEKESSPMSGNRTFVDATLIFRQTMEIEDIEAIFEALRGEYNE